MDNVLCFDIGGTAIKYGVIDGEGCFLVKGQFPTEAYLGGDVIVQKLIDKTYECMNDYIIGGIAISSAGIIDSTLGVVKETSCTMTRYKGICLKDILEDEFCIKVSVENDVNCALIGEYMQGDVQGYHSVFMMTIGTGVGGSFIVDGHVLKGKTFSVGEIGYLDIGGDCLDVTGSTRGLIQRVAKRKGIKDMDGKQIFDRALDGDRICIEEIDVMVDYITSAMAMIAYVLNSDCIVIGGAIAKQKSYLLSRMQSQLKSKLIPFIYNELEIKFASLGNDAGLIGARCCFVNDIL